MSIDLSIKTIGDIDRLKASKYTKEQVLSMIRLMYEKDISRDQLEDSLDNFPNTITSDICIVVSRYSNIFLKQ